MKKQEEGNRRHLTIQNSVLINCKNSISGQKFPRYKPQGRIFIIQIKHPTINKLGRVLFVLAEMGFWKDQKFWKNEMKAHRKPLQTSLKWILLWHALTYLFCLSLSLSLSLSLTWMARLLRAFKSSVCDYITVLFVSFLFLRSRVSLRAFKSSVGDYITALFVFFFRSRVSLVHFSSLFLLDHNTELYL